MEPILRRADEVAQSLEPVFEADDFGWEWPIGAVVGWRSHAIQRLEKMAKRHGRALYLVQIHGCQYWLSWMGFPLKKGWMILTTSKEPYLRVNKRCPGNHEHVECRGDAAKASSYYPEKLCQSILNAIQHQWKIQDRQMIYFTEKHLLNVEPELMVDLETDFPVEKVMALSYHGLDWTCPRPQRERNWKPSSNSWWECTELQGILEFPSCKIYYEHEALLHGPWNWVEPWNALNAKKLQSLAWCHQLHWAKSLNCSRSWAAMSLSWRTATSSTAALERSCQWTLHDWHREADPCWQQMVSNWIGHCEVLHQMAVATSCSQMGGACMTLRPTTLVPTSWTFCRALVCVWHALRSCRSSLLDGRRRGSNWNCQKYCPEAAERERPMGHPHALRHGDPRDELSHWE